MPTAVRSYLYIPGDRPDRLAKAFSRGADALIVDLEDSVAPNAKGIAREHVATWLDRQSEAHTSALVPIWVRINSGEQRDADIAALAGCVNLTGLILAKTNNPQDVANVDRQLRTLQSDLRLAPLIESAVGVLAAHAIAAGPRVDMLHLGEIDLAADLAATPGPDGHELHYSRSVIVLASRAGGISAPIAPVAADINDLDQFRATSQALARMGFYGRACIHPDQVTVSNEVYTPTASEQTWARQVLAAFGDGKLGVGRDASGNMVDEAVLRRARRITARSPSEPPKSAPLRWLRKIRDAIDDVPPERIWRLRS